MSSYVGKHAGFYDIFYRDKDYKTEAGFLKSWINKYSELTCTNILELACGTGNHAFELEKSGFNITALDYSPDMIAQAQMKKERINSKVDFQVGDMRQLPAMKNFDVVICLFDSIGYVLTNEALKEVFAGVHHNLTENGLFIFEFWHAGAMLKNYDPVRVKKFSSPEGMITRISETTIDHELQTGEVKYTIFNEQQNNISRIEESQKNRFFLAQEMRFIIESSNFTLLQYYDGYSDVDRITENTWHIIAIAKKNNAGRNTFK